MARNLSAKAEAPPRLPHPAEGLIVVKLGGSVVRGPELGAWLDVLAAAERPLVVVPGGGALANEVRACQQQLGFGDANAHRMALLAMDQLAWAIAGLKPRFDIVDTDEGIREALQARRVPVWAPYSLVSQRTDIPSSWTVTSDSLALWLAGRLEAGACYLVKSIRRKSRELAAQQLASEGIVDAAFPAMLKETGIAAFLLGQEDQAALATSLASNDRCGAPIV